MKTNKAAQYQPTNINVQGKKDSLQFLMTRAIDVLPLKTSERFLLQTLVRFLKEDRKDTIFPSVGDLAQKLSLSTSQTRKLIQSLSKKGFLRVEDAKILNKSKKLCPTSNFYYFPETIFAFQKYHEANLEYEDLNLLQVTGMKLEEAKKTLEEAQKAFKQEQDKIINAAPRESEVNAQKAFGNRNGIILEFQDPRSPILLNLKREVVFNPVPESTKISNIKERQSASAARHLRLAREILDTTEKGDSSKNESPDLPEKEATPSHPRKGGPSIEGRHIFDSKENFINNYKISTPKLVSSGDILEISPIINLCVDKFCQELGKQRPSLDQILKFQTKFQEKKFTDEMFEKNLQTIVDDPMLKKTTFSIMRVLDLEMALIAKENLRKNLLMIKANCLQWKMPFHPMSVIGATQWFDTDKEILEWLKETSKTSEKTLEKNESFKTDFDNEKKFVFETEDVKEILNPSDLFQGEIIDPNLENASENARQAQKVWVEIREALRQETRLEDFEKWILPLKAGAKWEDELILTAPSQEIFDQILDKYCKAIEQHKMRLSFETFLIFVDLETRLDSEDPSKTTKNTPPAVQNNFLMGS